MYCVKCGVKLDSALNKCPLCGIPIWVPESEITESGSFSDIYPPKKKKNERKIAAVTMTVISALAVIALLLICFNLYGWLRWGGYPVLGIALFYVTFILPLWFKKPNPVIFIPVSHAAAGGYLLYICLATGGSWFLSFAFPITIMSCLLFTAIVSLLRYVRGGRLYIFGGGILLTGMFSMLIELFQYITFHTPMVFWSLYIIGSCFVFGMFLILAGIIRPMREYLERKFFI